MEQGLESYDVCTGLLQSKAPEGAPYTVTLANLRSDAVISVEEVGVVKIKRLGCLLIAPLKTVGNFNLRRCGRGAFNTLNTLYEVDTNLDDGAVYAGGVVCGSEGRPGLAGNRTIAGVEVSLSKALPNPSCCVSPCMVDSALRV